MELKVRDVARLLAVSEPTVYRWIRARSLPAHRVHDQFHFNRVELQEWAALHRHRVSPKLFAPAGSAKELPSVPGAIERGGVYYGVAGKTRDEVLSAVSRLPGIPKGVDRRLLRQLLVAREALAPTSVGDGIALPHPRDPVVVHVEQPAVFLCFLENPVEFGALDGRPVSVLFMLLSPTVRDHLQVLARLAAALHDARFRELLHSAAPREEILSQLRAVEGERGE